VRPLLTVVRSSRPALQRGIPTGTTCRSVVIPMATGAGTVSAQAERALTARMKNGGQWPVFFSRPSFLPPSSERGQQADLVQQ